MLLNVLATLALAPQPIDVSFRVPVGSTWQYAYTLRYIDPTTEGVDQQLVYSGEAKLAEAQGVRTIENKWRLTQHLMNNDALDLPSDPAPINFLETIDALGRRATPSTGLPPAMFRLWRYVMFQPPQGAQHYGSTWTFEHAANEDGWMPGVRWAMTVLRPLASDSVGDVRVQIDVEELKLQPLAEGAGWMLIDGATGLVREAKVRMRNATMPGGTEPFTLEAEYKLTGVRLAPGS